MELGKITEKRDLLSVWNREKVSGKRTDKLPVEVSRRLYAEAKKMESDYSDCAISRKLGVARATIWGWLNTDRKPDGKINIINLQPRKELARFFGCFEVAGHIGKHKLKNSNFNKDVFSVWISVNDEKRLKILQDIIKNITGKKYDYYLDKKEKDDKRESRYIINVNNKHLVEFWEGYEGVPNHYGREEYIESRDKYPKSFLSGVLDVRGSIWLGDYPRLEIGSSKKPTKKQIGKVLDQLNIHYKTKIQEKNPRLSRFVFVINDDHDLKKIHNEIPMENKKVKDKFKVATIK